MQRNPSHFGSYSQPSPSGIERASLASIGSIGGCSGRSNGSIRRFVRGASRAISPIFADHGQPGALRV